MDGLSPYHAEEWNRKLSGFSKSVAGYPGTVEIVPFNVAGDRFGVTFGLVRPVVVIDIIRPMAVPYKYSFPISSLKTDV